MLRRQLSTWLLALAATSVVAVPLRAETITVRVNNNFFSPQDITINVGDTVQWRNVTGVGHNVVSCFPEQFGCDGQTSDTFFSSGAASTFFNYSFTFTEPGYNLYICQPHAPFMIGSVTVIAPTPPVVPDGRVDAPMSVRPARGRPDHLGTRRQERLALQRVRVERLEERGVTLDLSWSTAGCSGAESYHIVYGGGADLPATPGGEFGMMGAHCGVQDPSFTWLDSPDPTTDPKNLIWWLVVADDGVATEGSWGTDSQSQERTGPAPDGASGACGMVQKDVANTCGQ